MTSTFSTAAPAAAPFTLDAMMATAATIREHARAEPVATWMRDQGCDPDEGWQLVLPADFAAGVSMFPPSYVLVSTMIVSPILINPRTSSAFNPKGFP